MTGRDDMTADELIARVVTLEMQVAELSEKLAEARTALSAIEWICRVHR